MIELLIVIIVVRQYYKAAVNLNQSVWLWMILGACAYLVPAYTLAFLLAPRILGWFELGTDVINYIYATLITVLISLGFALVVLRALKRAVASQEPEKPFDQEF